jgi:folate-dependent phosphoribosylglycinamide formyltransferase PurN
MLAGPGDSTRIIYNQLRARFGCFPIVIEAEQSRKALLRTRIKKLGWYAVAQQILFMALIRPILDRRAKPRIEQIVSAYKLDRSPFPATAHVPSVNAPEVEALLKHYAPKVIVVNGTRIISRRILESWPGAVWLNTHAGITPQYRGAHGAYWALWNNDSANCGVTVHVVDSGIDTGAIVAQCRVYPERNDSFATYPMLQTAAGVPVLADAVAAALDGTLATRPAEGGSGVWYHPGAFQYLAGRLRGVR